MTDRSYIDANDRSRARLERLVSAMTPAMLATEIGAGWTVASALGHLGFWDEWQRERLNLMLAGEWKADDQSVKDAENLANLALESYWARFNAGDAPVLALGAARRLDELLSGLPDDLVDSIESSPANYLLHRDRHRNEHLDHIERFVAGAGSGVGAGSGAGAASSAAGDEAVDRSHLERNRDSLAKMREVFAGISPEDMQLPSGEGLWTVGQLIGHMGFWERFNHARWKEALARGSGAVPFPLPDGTADVLNDAQAQSWGSLASSQPPVVMAETVASAEALDELIATLPADVPLAKLLRDQPRVLDRSLHRAEHLAQIQTALAARK